MQKMAFFSCIRRYGRPQATIYQASQCILAITVQVIRSKTNSVTPKKLLKTPFVEKG